MKNITKIMLLIVAFVVSSTFAQDELPWLVISQQKVLSKNMEKVNELLKQAAPTLNELQKEGMLLGWGQVNHAWADNWNVNLYYVTKDRDSFFKFFDEFIKRMDEKFPNGENDPRQYFEEHKDNMYQIQMSYENPKLTPKFLVISQQIVAISNISKVNELTKKLAPILNKYVDEGKIAEWGQYNHSWGDEWNVNYYYQAKDHKSFVEFWDEVGKEIDEKHPGLMQELLSYFKNHKDNMYNYIQKAETSEESSK